MSDSEAFDVVFASDDRYAPHLAVAIRSLLHWNGGGVRVHVITDGLSDATRDALRSLAEGRGATLRIHVVRDEAFDDLPRIGHVSKATYYRLRIPEFVEAPLALYLDCDLVVNAPLAPLMRTDLGGYGLAAVEDPYTLREPFRDRLGMREGARYFNSGVMLMALDVWRRSGWEARVTELAARRPEAIWYADQCGLNAVVDGEWVGLAPKWNQQTLMHEWTRAELAGYRTPAELDEALAAPAIVHFTGPSKPWHADNIHPWRRLYWEHRQHVPFPPLRPPFSATRIAKLMVPRPVKRWYWARQG